MIIKRLQLTNYRNYEKIDVQFDPNVNVFMGNNAQGKTNLLESILYLSLTRSHRILDDKKLIRHSSPFARIRAWIDDEEEKILDVIIHPQGKTLAINGIAIKKVSDFIGKLNVILFSPDDLFIFNDQPKERRRWIDQEIAKINPTYVKHLNLLKSILKERNSLLKRERIDEMYYDILTERMIEHEEYIIEKRAEMIRLLNQYMSEIYESIAKEKKEIILEYKCCIHDLQNKKEALIDMHKASRQKDFDYRNSSEGIHREDYIYYMNDDLVVNCASQGQKRMIILSFKLALAKYIQHISGKEAIFLLDDVMSELDENHRNALLNQLIKNNQCIITTTEKLNIPNMAIYRVNDGEITGGKK